MSDSKESGASFSERPDDKGRRRFLRRAATVVGGIGLATAAVPFIEGMEPSAKTLAEGGPVDIDISKIEEGQRITGRWQSRPVWVVHRSKAALNELPKNNNRLRDPDSKEPQQPDNMPHFDPISRAVRPELFVVVPICTHLGCIPQLRPTPGAPDLGASWPGGFFCPCHGSRYDTAGRVYKGVPAPLNLEVPPYHYVTETRVLVGEGPGAAGAAKPA